MFPFDDVIVYFRDWLLIVFTSRDYLLKNQYKISVYVVSLSLYRAVNIQWSFKLIGDFCLYILSLRITTYINYFRAGGYQGTHLLTVIDQFHKPHNALDNYSTMHHFNRNVTKWCIVGNGTFASWRCAKSLLIEFEAWINNNLVVCGVGCN